MEFEREDNMARLFQFQHAHKLSGDSAPLRLKIQDKKILTEDDSVRHKVANLFMHALLSYVPHYMETGGESPYQPFTFVLVLSGLSKGVSSFALAFHQSCHKVIKKAIVMHLIFRFDNWPWRN